MGSKATRWALGNGIWFRAFQVLPTSLLSQRPDSVSPYATPVDPVGLARVDGGAEAVATLAGLPNTLLLAVCVRRQSETHLSILQPSSV